MRILLDGRPLQYAGPNNERTRLIFAVLNALTREHGIKWLLVLDQSWQPGSLPGITDLQLLIKKALPGRTGWRLWYDWQIPRVARRLRPDLVMLTGGIGAGPLPAPQSVWMPVHANPKETKNALPIYASRLTTTLRRGNSFFCFSESDRAWLSARRRPETETIQQVKPWAPASQTPLSAEERTTIKTAYAQDKEFFFADVSRTGEEDIVHLLKAFSIFKKRQLSNLQLVLAGSVDQLNDKLETYRYRQDVHWCNPSEAEKVMTSAYAALFLFDEDSLGTPLLQAWTSEVPVMVTAGTRLARMTGDAALAATAEDPNALASHMMSVYKDEAFRGRLIEKGRSRLPDFAADTMLARIWAMIGKTQNNPDPTPQAAQTAPQSAAQPSPPSPQTAPHAADI